MIDEVGNVHTVLLSMATSGDLYLATSGYFFIATDTFLRTRRGCDSLIWPRADG